MSMKLAKVQGFTRLVWGPVLLVAVWCLVGCETMPITATESTLTVAGSEPQVFLLHHPIHPPSLAQPDPVVTYEATAEDPDGVQEIVIWEDQRTLTDCTTGHVSQPPCSDRVSEQSVHACTYGGTNTKETCAYERTSAFDAAVNYVGYKAVATDAAGNSSDAVASYVYFAVGPYPYAQNNNETDDPIPVYITGQNLPYKVDLVFIPDYDYTEAYSAGWRDWFMLDASGLIKNAYFSGEPFAREIRARPGNWNFYLTYREAGDAEPLCSRKVPNNWLNMRTSVDTGLIVHLTEFSDCSDINGEDPVTWGTTFSAEPTSHVVVVHESGHAVFGLSDEYCGTLNFQNDNHPNVYDNKANCEGNPCHPTNACMEMCSRKPSDPRHCDHHAADLMRSTSSTNNFFDTCCQNRINWLYAECTANGSC